MPPARGATATSSSSRRLGERRRHRPRHRVGCRRQRLHHLLGPRSSADRSIGTHLGILQVKVDLENHIALEEPRSLWSGTGGQFPEAPHLYEVGRPLVPHDRRGRHRARPRHQHRPRRTRPEGPFETAPQNPLVSARSTIRPVQNTGHGDLVIGPDGEWLCVLLGVRPRSMTRAFSALGRETFVTPVRWQDDGWPAIDPVLLNARPGTRVEVDFSPDERARRRVARRSAASPADRRPHVAARLADAARRRLDARRPAPGLPRAPAGAPHQLA